MISEDLGYSMIQTFLDDRSFLACGTLIILLIGDHDCTN